MITIPQIVEKIILKRPFLEELLCSGLINLSSLARQIQPEIETALRKDVKSGAIVMALKRIIPSLEKKGKHNEKFVLENLGDIIVRSNLLDMTFLNSDTLVEKQTELLDKISNKKGVFYTFSQGVYETTLILSSSVESEVIELFKGENMLMRSSNLSSVTIKLAKDNNEMPGLYYFIFKRIAWEGINICEVISTTHEFTIVVNDNDVNKVFSMLMELKKNNEKNM